MNTFTSILVVQNLDIIQFTFRKIEASGHWSGRIQDRIVKRNQNDKSYQSPASSAGQGRSNSNIINLLSLPMICTLFTLIFHLHGQAGSQVSHSFYLGSLELITDQILSWENFYFNGFLLSWLRWQLYKIGRISVWPLTYGRVSEWSCQ